MSNTDDINKLAKTIWELRGRPEGCDVENWDIAVHVQRVIDGVKDECGRKLYLRAWSDDLILKISGQASFPARFFDSALIKEVEHLADQIMAAREAETKAMEASNG